MNLPPTVSLRGRGREAASLLEPWCQQSPDLQEPESSEKMEGVMQNAAEGMAALSVDNVPVPATGGMAALSVDSVAVPVTEGMAALSVDNVPVPVTEGMAALSVGNIPVMCCDNGVTSKTIDTPFEYSVDAQIPTYKADLAPLPRNTSSEGVSVNDRELHHRTEDNDQHVHEVESKPTHTDTDKAYGKNFSGEFQGSDHEELLSFVANIEFEAPESGVYLKDCSSTGFIKPSSGMFLEKREFTVVKPLHPSSDVLLCQDKSTGCQFVLKTIVRSRLHFERLVGIEFLVRHHKVHFLPDVYAAYKDEKHFYIFEQYLGEHTVDRCDWNLEKVHKFTKKMLQILKYLHDNEVVHYDIKPLNVMVLDPDDPESVVPIDFESAKSADAEFHKGGYTLIFLPQWHEAILSLEDYDPILMSGDLWAVACMVMMFLQPSARQESSHWRVWRQKHEEIQLQCRTCKTCKPDDTSEYQCVCNKCVTCKEKFLNFLKEEGHKILDIHLSHLMEREVTDPTLKKLMEVLKYLTSNINIDDKSADEALRILDGD